MMNGELGDLQAQMEAFRQSDAQKTAFMQTITDRYHGLERSFHEKCKDFDNEVESRRMWQNIAADAKRELQHIRQTTDNYPFVLALIDGDGALFQDFLVRAGSEGGSEAAHLLHNEIKKYIQGRDENTGRWDIMVHIYANLDGLSKVLSSLGVIDSPGRLHAFARSFSMSQPLFNFVDVGSGKENADHKIKQIFQTFLFNCHCKHIIFAGCHDNGYLTTLNQYKRDEGISARITLLETTPAERGYSTLAFPITRFTSVFRSESLPDYRTMTNLSPHPGATFTALLSPGLHLPRNLPSPATPFVPQALENELPQSQLAHSPTPPREQTPVTQVARPSVSTYAEVGKSSEKVISIALSKPPQRRKAYYLNANNERIDEKLPKPDKESQARLAYRIKEQKVCNDYHLNGKCYNDYCGFSHGERIGPKEQLALRTKARLRACNEGSECRDVNCLYGHVCPNELCTWDQCYFGNCHIQQIDQVPRMRVFEDDTIEYLK